MENASSNHLKKLYALVKNLTPDEREEFCSEIITEHVENDELIWHLKERDVKYVSGVHDAINLLEKETGNYIVIAKTGDMAEAIREVMYRF